MDALLLAISECDARKSHLGPETPIANSISICSLLKIGIDGVKWKCSMIGIAGKPST